jgi:hypothetical protein
MNKGVMLDMCFSNNAIEQLAYEISKKIYENSIYKIVKIEFIGGHSIELQKQQRDPFVVDAGRELPLITKILLEGENGIFYSIEPNLNGLQFAKGEITYKEYNNIQKGEKIRGLIYVSISIIAFLLVGWAIVEYLT